MQISIIIPIYNASLYLRECLDSVLAQTFSDYEIILVNDGSTDDSLKICEEYASKYDKIIVLTGENAGVSAARNKGLDVATGEWVVFADADDVMLPEALDTLYGRAVTTGANLILGNAVKLINDKISSPLHNLKKETLPNIIHGIKHFALWGYLIRREIIEDYKLRFIEGLAYSEDRLFIYQLACHCKTITYTDKSVYVYRINPTSACSNTNGLRKAKHQFIAASHLHKMAQSFKQTDRSVYKLLKNESLHTADLGIYQFLQVGSGMSVLRDLKSIYRQYLRCDLIGLCWLYIRVIINYLTIQRRKLIKFKRAI